MKPPRVVLIGSKILPDGGFFYGSRTLGFKMCHTRLCGGGGLFLFEGLPASVESAAVATRARNRQRRRTELPRDLKADPGAAARDERDLRSGVCVCGVRTPTTTTPAKHRAAKPLPPKHTHASTHTSTTTRVTGGDHGGGDTNARRALPASTSRRNGDCAGGAGIAIAAVCAWCGGLTRVAAGCGVWWRAGGRRGRET